MIPLNDFRRQWRDIGSRALEAFAAVGESGWYILGAEVRAFETALARYWGLAHCAGVASGLDAIGISLQVLGCGPGERVLTTPLSAFATTLAIARLGAIPVFVDTGEDGLIDLDACAQALARRPDIRFLVPVHLYGNPLDPDRLAALRARFGCRIVEDCAQSAGASFNHRPTGSAGHLAATSFYPTKNLGAMGDGGAILTADETLCRTARSLRDYGQTAKYRHELCGWNSRLDELQAALLARVCLPLLDGWIARRRQIARRYAEGIRHPLVRPLAKPPGSESCRHLFPVLVPPGRKQEFMRWLESRGVASGEHYPVPIPDQPAMARIPHEVFNGYSRAAALCRSQVSLPIHPYLTAEETAQVVEAVNGWPVPPPP